MARPLSDEKRDAILAATASVIATDGTGGSIARIATAAGVAEGTIFTYFADKDTLLNEVYLAIKRDIALAVTGGLSSRKGLKARCQYVWEGYIGWGLAHPAQHKAINQLAVSERIAPATKERARLGFSEVGLLLDELAATGGLPDQTPAFIGALMEAIGEMTLSFAAREPKRAAAYKRSGFDAFWRAVSAT